MMRDTGKGISRALNAVMARYGFAKLHPSKPTHSEEKWVFIGAHNAGNAAVATTMVAIAQALDKVIATMHEAHSEAGEDLEEGWLKQAPIRDRQACHATSV